MWSVPRGQRVRGVRTTNCLRDTGLGIRSSAVRIISKTLRFSRSLPKRRILDSFFQGVSRKQRRLRCVAHHDWLQDINSGGHSILDEILANFRRCSLRRLLD